MPIIYKQNCKECKKNYEGRGALFCSNVCRSNNKEWKNLQHIGHLGQKVWNKGLKGVVTAWNKGLLGYLSGTKHYNWKGGISKGYKTGYYSDNYKKWRIKVFERDGYVCSECGSGGYITAHHIKSFAHYPELRFDLNNGLTLCEFCHSKTDNYKGRAKNKLNLQTI